MATEERRPLSSATPQDSPHLGSHTPLPAGDDFDPNTLHEPRAPFLSAGAQSPRNSSLRDSYAQPGTPTESGLLLENKEAMPSSDDELGPTGALAGEPRHRRRWLLVLIVLLILIVLLVAIVVPIYFTVIKPKVNAATTGGTTTGTAAPTSTSKPKGPTSSSSITGGDGSTVRATNGTTFTYNNKLGGIWYHDPQDPYNNNAYPNSWTPPLNQSWDYTANRIFGVNLGGWFVLEPFITPALYQKYAGAVDEWTISTLMAADTASGGLTQLETHYQTFITEDDFAEMAGAGLNWVRIPIPFWAIDVFDGEPFLAKTCWKYILQALQWCRKYGLRVKIDLHTAPGSQNGYNHSGKSGQINFLVGTMGYANAQRMLNYIRIFTEFFSQPEWNNIIGIFGIVNEPIMGTIGEEQLKAFNYEAYQTIRQITGIGAGNGPYVSIHDSFLALTTWVGSLTGADRVALDSHPYFAFSDPAPTDSPDTGTGAGAGGPWPAQACSNWASQFNTSRNAFGVTFAGEWSVALNDCGLFVKGTTLTSTYSGGCTQWEDSSNWTAGWKAGLMQVAMASMDSLKDWFFWTWKVAPSQTGVVGAPAWSYQLGLRGGWIPKDPRTALGTCGSTGPVFAGFSAWMTGGTGAGQMQTSFPWPPASINKAPADPTALPSYTPTGVINTLPVPTYTDSAGKPVVSGNGWFNANDNTPAPTPIAGCTYPDPWDALTAAVPAGCGFGAAGAVAVPSRSRTTTTTTGTTTGTTTTIPAIATTTTDVVVV